MKFKTSRVIERAEQIKDMHEEIQEIDRQFARGTLKGKEANQADARRAELIVDLQDAFVGWGTTNGEIRAAWDLGYPETRTVLLDAWHRAFGENGMDLSEILWPERAEAARRRAVEETLARSEAASAALAEMENEARKELRDTKAAALCEANALREEIKMLKTQLQYGVEEITRLDAEIVALKATTLDTILAACKA